MFPRARANGTAPQPLPPQPAPAEPLTAAAPPGGAAQPASGEDLLARRQELAHELADRQWDLGGMTYEMAIRDHFRLDVLQMHAARLQQIDAQLAEIERQIRLGDAAAAGECGTCGAPFSRGAVYCYSCGSQLIPVESVGT
jgi:hypothetical protein